MNKEKQVILSWEEWSKLNADLEQAHQDTNTALDSKMLIKTDFVGIINVSDPMQTYGYQNYGYQTYGFTKDGGIVYSRFKNYDVYIAGDKKAISKRLIGLIKECQKVNKEMAKRQEVLYEQLTALRSKLSESEKKEKIVYKDKIVYKSWWTKF